MIDKIQDSPNANWFLHGSGSVGNFPNVIRSFMGRDAISLLLCNLIKNNGVACKTALLPAYACPEVSEVFEKWGFKVIYYDTLMFRADRGQVEQVLEKNEIGIYYFIDYFGIIQHSNQEIIDVVKRASLRTFVIEDRAHYLCDKEIFENVDAYVFSFRKLLPIPEGGGVLTDVPIEYGYKKRMISNVLAVVMVLKKILLKHNPRFSRASLSKHGISRTAGSTTILAPSAMSLRIIDKVDINDEIAMRKRLFAKYLERAKSAGLMPLFEELKDGDIPQGFPIITKDATAIQYEMNRQGMYLKRHWKLSDDFKQVAPAAYSLSKKVITLPIYRGIYEEDIGKIIEKLMEIPCAKTEQGDC